MKYTIPYDDKITLPHIKKIEGITIKSDQLSYDDKELAGEVVVSGDYRLDNSQDIMEFSHDIPVSFLIDDVTISPQIKISNFKYELIPSKGIEIMFELDIILIEEEEQEKEVIPRKKEEKEIENVLDENEIIDEDKDIKEFQNQIDENLDAVLTKNKPKEKERNEEENDNEKRFNIFKKEKHETPSEQDEEQDIIHTTLEEEEETPMTEVLEDVMGIDLPKDEFTTSVTSSHSQFDPSFISSENDKYTTYKVLLVEEDDNIDELLEERNLSRALICSEYNFEDKIVLKIENE